MQAEVLERGADLVLHVGDIAYANGDVAIWDTFMAEVEPYAAAAPYMVAIGNHEARSLPAPPLLSVPLHLRRWPLHPAGSRQHPFACAPCWRPSMSRRQ